MDDFFDQNVGEEDDTMMEDAPEIESAASVLVNGSRLPLEVGGPVLPTMKSLALEAGFGKFKVWLNGTEIRPKAISEGRASAEIRPEDNFEIRPFDEAG